VRFIDCKNEGMLLQPLGWCYAGCAVNHERNVCEEQDRIYVVRTSNNRVIMSDELYCCLLPQCEALCTCRSGFPIATIISKNERHHGESWTVNHLYSRCWCVC